MAGVGYTLNGVAIDSRYCRVTLGSTLFAGVSVSRSKVSMPFRHGTIPSGVTPSFEERSVTIKVAAFRSGAIGHDTGHGMDSSRLARLCTTPYPVLSRTVNGQPQQAVVELASLEADDGGTVLDRLTPFTAVFALPQVWWRDPVAYDRPVAANGTAFLWPAACRWAQPYWTRWEGEPNNSTSLLADFYTYWLGEPNNSASVLVPLSSRITGVYVYDGSQWNEVNLVAANILATGSVVASNMAANSITSDKIVSGSVIADKLAANSVVAGKIAANAVNAAAIVAGAITTGKLAALAVTADKLAAKAVIAGKIAANAVTAETIAAGAVVADKLAANSVNASKIVSGAVTADKLAADSVDASKIVAQSITGDRIASNTIVARNIAAQSITSDRIAAGQFTGYVFTGSIFRTSGSNPKVEMTSSGIHATDSTGKDILQIGYNIETGLAVINPLTKLLTPLSWQAFAAQPVTVQSNYDSGEIQKKGTGSNTITWIDTGSSVQFNTGFTGTVSVMMSSWLYARLTLGSTSSNSGSARMCVGLQILDGFTEVHSYKNDCVINHLEGFSNQGTVSNTSSAATFSRGFTVSLSKNKSYTAKIWMGYRWTGLDSGTVALFRGMSPFVQITPCVN